MQVLKFLKEYLHDVKKQMFVQFKCLKASKQTLNFPLKDLNHSRNKIRTWTSGRPLVCKIIGFKKKDY